MSVEDRPISAEELDKALTDAEDMVASFDGNMRADVILTALRNRFEIPRGG